MTASVEVQFGIYAFQMLWCISTADGWKCAQLHNFSNCTLWSFEGHHIQSEVWDIILHAPHVDLFPSLTSRTSILIFLILYLE